MSLDRRTHPDRRIKADESVFLREAVDHAARVWVLTGAKPGKHYTYIDGRWAETSIKFDGEANPPRRREADKESYFLSPGKDGEE